MEAGEKAGALLPITQDTYTGTYIQHQLVRIYIEGRRAREGAGPARAAAQNAVLPLARLAPDRSSVRSAADETRGF